MPRCVLLLALLVLVPPPLFADQFVIRDIRVKGLNRITAGTVFSDLPIVVGDRVDETQSSFWVKALYETGHFEDVYVARDGDVVVFTVTERPGLAGIVFAGNKNITEEQLIEVLEQVGIAVGKVFNRHSLEILVQGLTEQYQALGNFNVRISTEVQELPRNQIRLEITVDEGKASRIKEFKIIGNRRITDKELFRNIESGTSRWYEFWNTRDNYSRVKLAGDIEAIRSVYFNKGFLDFEVTGTRVSLNSDKRNIYVEIIIDEGKQYRIGNVSLSCRSRIDRTMLESRVALREGALFSRAAILNTSRDIELELQDIGYANAKVSAIPDKKPENRTVDIAFLVEPGRKTYVRRVNLLGNHDTSDETFRRELRQLEASEYSARKIELSKRRLQRLPYVQTAEVEVRPVSDKEADQRNTGDRVDLDFRVVEARSGNFSLGAGYSDAEGAVVSFGLNQDNFLGTGNRVGFTFNNSSVNTNYTVSFFDPFYTIDGISRSWSVLYRSIDNSERDINNTETEEARARLGFGIPLSEDDTLNVSLALQDIKLSPGNDIGARLREYYEDQCGWTQSNARAPRVIKDCSFFNLIVTPSFEYDTRDRALFPSEGARIRGSLQTFIPLDGLAYYKLDYLQQQYVSLKEDSDDYIFAGKTRVSYAGSYGKTVEVPPYDRFFAGGAKSLRGYFNNSLGPRDDNNDPLGGEFRVLFGGDLYFPTDFLYNRKRLRMSAFVDYGNIFEDVEDFSLSDMRGAYGLHVRWLTAVGGISFSFSSHFKDRPGDETESFQFDLGGVF